MLRQLQWPTCSTRQYTLMHDISQRAWVCYQPHNGTDVNTPGIYLNYVNSNHYRVVKSIM